MSNEHNRRTFLRLSALGLTAVAAAEMPRPLFSAEAAAPAGEIRVWVTGGQQRFAAGTPLKWKSGAGASENAIRLDPGKKFQQILGFGAAFTDASCYMFNQLSASAREQLFHELFHPSEMGLNVCRTCVGASDYSTEVFSYDEGEPDPEMKRFSIEHDRAYVLPMLRQARKVNPDLFLFSSPWSPPGWMKMGGSMLGGVIRQRNFEAYAKYFLKFVQAYAAEGAPVQAVSVQNEVDTDQDGRMPACAWPQEYEIGFVREHLGPLFQKEGVSTQIWFLDHNYNLWGRAICELDDAGFHKFTNSIAWHGYVGAPEMMSKVHEAHPEVNMYWTEGGPDYKAPDFATDWVNWGQTYIGALRNWCQSITGWNLALDELGRPNIGPFSCGGMVTIHSQTKEISRSGQYWGFAHFSRAVRRGANRFESVGSVAGVEHVAFENPGGQKVLVLTNAGGQKNVAFTLGGAWASVELAANSLTTLVWE